MKKILIFSLISILLLPALFIGCTAETPTPSVSPTPAATTIEISTDEFTAQNHVVKMVELTLPGSLIVSLGSNPTTGFQWAGSANISDPSVIGQASHNFVEPQASGETPVVGAPGKDVWAFNSLKAGSANISLSYGRPWEGGEKDVWTLTLNVTVK